MSVDFIQAVTSYLKADATVADVVGVRVFGSELPADEAKQMPQDTVVCVATGGPGQTDDVPFGKWRVDVLCYGATPYNARTLYFLVNAALRKLARVVVNETLLHSAIQTAGPLQMRQQDTQWPICWSCWQLGVGEETVT